MRMRLLKHISVLSYVWVLVSDQWSLELLNMIFLLIDDVSDLLLGEVGGEVGEVRLVAKLS